jgi:hypothetical protein
MCSVAPAPGVRCPSLITSGADGYQRGDRRRSVLMLPSLENSGRTSV